MKEETRQAIEEARKLNMGIMTAKNCEHALTLAIAEIDEKDKDIEKLQGVVLSYPQDVIALTEKIKEKDDEIYGLKMMLGSAGGRGDKTYINMMQKNKDQTDRIKELEEAMRKAIRISLDYSQHDGMVEQILQTALKLEEK